MRRSIIVMLVLLLCGAIHAGSAQPPSPAPECLPDAIVDQLDKLIDAMSGEDAASSLPDIKDQLVNLRNCYTATSIPPTPQVDQISDLAPAIFSVKESDNIQIRSTNDANSVPSVKLSGRYAILSKDDNSGLWLVSPIAKAWVWGGFFAPPNGTTVKISRTTQVFDTELDNHKPLYSVSTGTPVKILASASGHDYEQWVQIQYPPEAPKTTGWVKSGYVWDRSLLPQEIHVTVNPGQLDADTPPYVTARSTQKILNDPSNVFSAVLQNETVRVGDMALDDGSADSTKYGGTLWLQVETVSRIVGYIPEVRIIGDIPSMPYAMISTNQKVSLQTTADPQKLTGVNVPSDKFVNFLKQSGDYVQVIFPREQLGWITPDQVPTLQ